MTSWIVRASPPNCCPCRSLPPRTSEDPGFATRLARAVNEEFAELAERYPGRFGAFASLPGDSPEVMLAEIDYARRH
ncbi:hypothetical protein OG596_34595 [Streptomyces sp. NBC_01102]|uniref:hypothetical protein n=1 Tax=Streptomyces sp. NBC_01102 TaxID=2903749 RepID=UPI00386E354E|nr:hypothetical protein OG596_34595 [Streptomyces sp. NBC_01102]